MTMASSPAKNNNAAALAAKENTVFVRFIPPSANIRRHHLEDLFSQIGPIRKSSVIVPRPPKPAKGAPPPSPYAGGSSGVNKVNEEETKPSSYGFIKYTTPQDASAAAAKLHHATIKLSDTETIQIRVERASDAAHTKSPDKNKKHTKQPSSEFSGKESKKQQPNKSPEEPNKSQKRHETQPLQQSKQQDTSPNVKDNRLIIRNLSFYAKESHIRQVLESQFGKIVEVHIPQVPTTNSATDKGNKKAKGVTHRGFCFVTFEKPGSVQACLQAKDSIVIKERSVTVERALNKTMFENKKKKETEQGDSVKSDPKNGKKKDLEKIAAVDDDETGSSSDGDDDDSAASGENDDDDASEHSDEDGDSDMSHDEKNDDEKMKESDSENDKQEDDKRESSNNRDENAVSDKRALFVRNLPFDVTRHDLFELFHKFGYITGIFLVKDKETNIHKGTAFVSFRDHASVTKALDQARADDKFVPQREASEKVAGSTDMGAELSIKGRRVFINLALDKDTASTLVMEKASDRLSSGKDRRNLYLKGEGRVDNENEQDTTWDDLPEQDKFKRQKAWSDKNTKLRSPIFFINPTRLSIRNLSKAIDEQDLKKLCVEATKRGLDRGLVTVEDVIAHWRASGDMTSREIMARVEGEGAAVIAPFDEKNVKKHIPSVFIDRDFSGAKKSDAPSRGFGFVEFESHVHALACLRELNNNTRYSPDYAAGGQHATQMRKKSHKRKKPAEASDFIGSDGQAKVPRLIVEFTVENKAKARQQADHRAQQQANRIKQKIENKEKSEVEKKKEKKMSRGAKQRERKRKGVDDEEKGPVKQNATTEVTLQRKQKEEKPKEPQVPAPKPVKPAKKQKVDKEESRFDKLVMSYEVGFAAEPDLADAPKKPKKRWYEG